MDLGLAGKVAVVTGASRGIGRAIAEVLADEGAHVGICAREPAGVSATVAALRQRGTGVFGQALDVTDANGAAAFIDAAAAELGGLDILVNNVGGSRGAGVIGSSDEEWRATFELNLFHSVRMTRAAVPHLQRRGGGSVVIIASISGFRAAPGSQYGTAKAAEIFLSPALALELGCHAIRVNTVCPGSIVFPGGGWADFRDRDPAGYREFERREFPLGRLGTPEEVARAVAFVASPAGGWINGAAIAVDGAQQRPNAFVLGAS